MIKSLKRNDIRYTPFVANKSWNSQNQRFDNSISWQDGSESGSLFLTFPDYDDGTNLSQFSSSIAYQQQDDDFLRFKIGKEITGSTFYPVQSVFYNPDTNPVNIDDSYQSLVYNTAKNLYYKESENPTQMFGLESLNPVGINRTLTKEITEFTVPVNKFGEKIEPLSVEINHDLPIGYTTVIDDGNNNLKISGSTFSDIQNPRYNCVTASINHFNLSVQYDGTPKSVSVSTVPSGLTVETTYDGKYTPPTDVGSYTVFSEIFDGFYCGTQTDTFDIQKIDASFTVTSVTNTYDGMRHDVEVYVDGVLVSYNNRAGFYIIEYTKNTPIKHVSDPIEIGIYSAKATLVHKQYSSKSANGTSTILCKASNLIFNPISNITYGDVWEIIPVAKDTVNNFPINFTITPGHTLAEISGIMGYQKILLVKTQTATSLGTVLVTATTVPNNLEDPTAISISTSQTFTVYRRSLTITDVSAKDQETGLGTTVNLNNGNKKLNGVLIYDTVSSGEVPTTGTISVDTPGYNYPVTPSFPYTISGTHSDKYLVTQPTITVSILTPKRRDSYLEATSSLVFTYDSFPWNLKDILTADSFEKTTNLSSTLKATYYDGSGKESGTETYTTGSQKGHGPKNIGNYKVSITHTEDFITDTLNETFEVRSAPVTIHATASNQGGMFYINNSEKYKIKPLKDQIVDIKVTSMSFKLRNGNTKTIDASNLDVSITYNTNSTRPNLIGNYYVIIQPISTNFYGNKQFTWTIDNFIYIVSNSVYETCNEPTYMTTSFISPYYNLRKYVDPYVTGSWPTVVENYPQLNSSSFTNLQISQSVKMILTGPGGGTAVFPVHETVSLPVFVSYYDSKGNPIQLDNNQSPHRSTFQTSHYTFDITKSKELITGSLATQYVGKTSVTPGFKTYSGRKLVPAENRIPNHMNSSSYKIEQTAYFEIHTQTGSLKLHIQAGSQTGKFPVTFYELFKVAFTLDTSSLYWDNTNISQSVYGTDFTEVIVRINDDEVLPENDLKVDDTAIGNALKNMEIVGSPLAQFNSTITSSKSTIYDYWLFKGYPRTEMSYDIPLKKGVHKIQILYYKLHEPESETQHFRDLDIELHEGCTWETTQWFHSDTATTTGKFYDVNSGNIQTSPKISAKHGEALGMGSPFMAPFFSITGSISGNSRGTDLSKCLVVSGQKYRNGGSGGSIGITFPTQYIIDKNITSSRFVVGASAGLIQYPTEHSPRSTYFVTGSKYLKAYLTIEAGGGRSTTDDVFVNSGSTLFPSGSATYVNYQGTLNPTNPFINSIFNSYNNDIKGLTWQYNKAVNGVNGYLNQTAASVDLSGKMDLSGIKYGEGSRNNQYSGSRGTFVLSIDDALSEIYINSSSVYNVKLIP